MLTLGILHTLIRADEKLLLQAATRRNIKTKLVDVRDANFNPLSYKPEFDLALERCISTVKGSYATKFLESRGITVLNPSTVANICEDKFLTSLVLQKNNVPTPNFTLVFSTEEAKKASEQLGGYPVIIKPTLGSWGRLLAKINDVDSLEAIIEHKDILGSPQQKPIYIQQYIDKPGRDIRLFVIDGQAICAIYRKSEHWITNTARGGNATNCRLNSQLRILAKNASEAVGGGILAMDIFETTDGYTVNEINHTMEFKNSEEPTGVDISGTVIDYCLEVYKKL